MNKLLRKIYKKLSFIFSPLYLFCFFIFLTCCINSAYPQIDIAKVNVDEWSDSQIQQVINKASSLGYTSDAQISQMAIAQGMSQSEAQKLILRIDKLNSQNSQIQNKGFDNRSLNSPDSLNSSLSANVESEQSNIPKIFGADLFGSNGRISFEPNLRIATPKNYVIGPDDQLLIDITGDNEASYKPKVTPDGTISLQYVGLISVGGLTIEQATSKIKGIMSKTYPGLRTGRTNVAINLGNIRSIKVTIVGEAVKPGTYTLSSLSTMFNALYASGGPNKNGSFRNIQVIRNGREVATVDVYDFLLKGIQKNIRLQDQDVINIPVYKTRIEMSGEVKRPALYEMLTSENLQDAINFAGGFTSQAYTAGIKILENTARERKIVDVSSEEYQNYKPVNGDKVIVEKILDRFANRVQIKGAVFRPGMYELDKGLTLKQLILKANGLKEDAFLNRGYISRLNLDNTLSLISFDVGKIMDGAEQDIPLQREDQVTITSIFDLRDEYRVQIQGEVRSPGTFRYEDNLTLEALIQMAGGFKEGATPDRIEVARRIQNSNALSKSSPTAQIFTVNVDKNLQILGQPFVLKPFDIVSVRSAEGYEIQRVVKIQGEVLYPGSYTLERKNEKISDVLRRAGGLTALAFPQGASLKRPGPFKDSTNTASNRQLNQQNEESQRLQNLKRIQLARGIRDTSNNQLDTAIIKSDYVGIDLPRILRDSSSRYNLLMEDGDILSLPRQLQTVKVNGEVLKSINIVYQNGKSMEQYINEAGGFNYNADKKAAYVVYANGSVKAAKHFLFFYSYPSVKPGSEIFVPKHPPRQPLGVQGIVGLSTALASLAVIIITLFKK